MSFKAIEEVKKEIRQGQKQLTLLMLGGVDVGKTCTVTSIAIRFYEQGLKVAVVDADGGQSDIGPPCCIGMGILEKRIRKLSEVPLHSPISLETHRLTDVCVNACEEQWRR